MTRTEDDAAAQLNAVMARPLYTVSAPDADDLCTVSYPTAVDPLLGFSPDEIVVGPNGSLVSDRSPNGTRRKPTLVPLTDAERDELRAAAAAAGQKLATWIRRTALDQARRLVG